jgi:hypothetical protein
MIAMEHQRLRHDAAWAVTLSIMECIDGVFRPEERKDAFDEIYQRVRAGIEAYDQQVQREAARLKPSRN